MLNDSIKSLTMYRLLIRRLRSQFMVPFSPVQCRVKRVCCEKLTCSGRLSDGGLHVDFDDAETKHIGCFSVEWDQGIEISNKHNVSDLTKFPVIVSTIEYEHC